MNLDEHTSMSALSPVEQATKALRHVLTRIATHPGVGWYLGYATETFALTTEAFATLTQQNVAVVRKNFAPQHAADPAVEIESAAVEPGTPRIQLTEDEIGLLDELAAHHDTRAVELTQAAATAGQQQGAGLYHQAERHSQWEDELENLAARGRAVESEGAKP